MLFWQVPAPDEALLISGSKHKDAATQFRIVTGHGAFVLPIKQKARLLSLALREAELAEVRDHAGDPAAEAGRDTTRLNTEAESARRTALAEADAAAARAQASGEADAARLTADADAYAAKTVADADAQAINARADALSGEHQGLIAANKLVDMLPALVQASASGIEGARLTILGGSAGVNDFATGLAAQGLSLYTALQSVLAAGRDGDRNGHDPEGEDRVKAEIRPSDGAAN